MLVELNEEECTIIINALICLEEDAGMYNDNVAKIVAQLYPKLERE